jgi:endo-1,4-beta-xylanase
MLYYHRGINIGVIATMYAAFLFLSASQVAHASASKEYCSSSTGSMSNGYNYEYWKAGGGSACMTVYNVDATFKANWSSSGDFLARIGLRYNETKTPDEIGKFSSEFACTKTSVSGLCYIGIYGWTNSPLIEYYIIEDWVNSQWTSAPSVGTKKAAITVDSGSYFVYTNQRTGASIHGDNVTFMQFYSIRQKGRQSGHISISRHFSIWDSLGMQMGKLYEVKLLVEGMNNGSGTVDFTKGIVVLSTTGALVPEISKGHGAFSENSNIRGVGTGRDLAQIISLNGSAISSLRPGNSEPPANGLYFLWSKGDRKAPVTRAVLIR